MALGEDALYVCGALSRRSTNVSYLRWNNSLLIVRRLDACGIRQRSVVGGCFCMALFYI